MSPTCPDTILDHPALAGRTVYVRRGPAWETYLIRTGGGLAPCHDLHHEAPAASWRPSIGA